MNYKIYIEALNGFPRNDWSCSAYLGFKERQADIYFYEDIKEVPTQRNIVLVGCIEDTNEFLSRFGLAPKMALNIPGDLWCPGYLKRSLWNLTLGELLEGKANHLFPMFIKPAGRSKGFVAGIVRNVEQARLYFNNLYPETEMLCSEVVNFVSEYRCYIIESKVVGIKHYLGDIFTFPDTNHIQEMVKAYTSAPAGYSLDVGILDSGETVLVECNDGWSLGNYGLESNLYVRLLVARWRELFKPENILSAHQVRDPDRKMNLDKNDIPGLLGIG